jgi:hypothetical protein
VPEEQKGQQREAQAPDALIEALLKVNALEGKAVSDTEALAARLRKMFQDDLPRLVAEYDAQPKRFWDNRAKLRGSPAHAIEVGPVEDLLDDYSDLGIDFDRELQRTITLVRRSVKQFRPASSPQTVEEITARLASRMLVSALSPEGASVSESQVPPRSHRGRARRSGDSRSSRS